LMPSGVTTRAHTRSAGASRLLCRSIIMTVQRIPPNRAAGGYLPTDADYWYHRVKKRGNLREALPGEAVV
jgi:hypothetical protein